MCTAVYSSTGMLLNIEVVEMWCVLRHFVYLIFTHHEIPRVVAKTFCENLGDVGSTASL